jgi:Fur family transcriptional regulator, stress-responsive regulator
MAILQLAMKTAPTEVQSPVPGDAAPALRAAGYRVTPQRLVIHGTLVELGRHVGAEELLDAVQGRLPNVSLPTVYSALEALEESGLVRRVSASQGRALYDARPADHHHLVCRRCGAVEDLDEPVPLSGALASARERGFMPDGAEVVIRGLCASCRRG